MSFNLSLLGEIAEFKGGKRLPKGKMLTSSNTGHPYIRITDISNHKIDLGNILYVSKEDQEKISRYIVKADDLILTIVGTIGLVAIVPETLDKANLTENCIKINLRKDILDTKFAYYYLTSKEGQDQIHGLNVGSTQPKLPLYNIAKIEIPSPSLQEQAAIAEVLSSIDDKIDLLHRNNKTLEEMAETLFRQWFVEGAKEEWEMGTLGELVLVKRGGSPRPIQDFLSDSGLRWLKISDVTSVPSPYVFNIKEYIKEEGIKKTVLLKKGSLIVSNSATPGIPKILAVDSCIHDGWLYFPESQLSNEFLYLFFLKIKTELVSLGNGSIFTNLKTDIVKNFPILKPDAQTLEKFDDIISPVFKKMYSNTVQLLSLTETRDVLLPKLMSGQVRVKH